MNGVLRRSSVWLAVLALFSGGCRHGEEEAKPPEWRIVFSSDRGGEFAFWSIRPDGRGLVRIESTGWILGAQPPVVAPDGTKLLLPRSDELVVVDAGGRRQRLASGDATTAVWSPDGERVVFRGPGLSVVDADGKNLRRLTHDRDDSAPVWSPRGDRIAFLRGWAGVGVVAADGGGGGARVVWRGGAESLSWTNDGRALSFMRVRDYVPTAERITLDAASGRVLKTTRGVSVGDSYTERVPSPDGRRIAFTRSAGPRARRLEIVVANSDGTSPRRITGPREYARSPVWAPDGRSIVYIHDDAEGAQLWSVRTDGTRRRRITRGLPDGGDVYTAAWARVTFPHRPSPLRIRAGRTQSGGELDLPFPVVALGASGPRVALASPVRVYAPSWILTPPLVIWDPVGGDVSRLTMRSCAVPDSIVLAGGEIAFDCDAIPHAVAHFGGAVYVSRADRRRAVALNPGELDAEGGKPGRLPGRVAGENGAVVFAVDAFDGDADYVGSTLWRVDGRRSERISRDVGEPVAVDGGRVLTEHPSGRVALLDLDGRLIRVFAPGGHGETPRVYGAFRPSTAGLSGRDLVVIRGGRLAWYDAATGRRRGVLRVEERAVFAGVARGLAAYTARDDIHVVRLRGGDATILRAPGRSVEARLTDAGLFYAFHTRHVGRRTMLEHERNPARVVFLRRSFLETRLR